MEPSVDITELYAAHRLVLVRLAVLLVDDVASAEDVVQDAFAALARRPGAVRDPSKALAYLRVSVVNAARSALRRRGTARAYAPPHDLSPPSPEDLTPLALVADLRSRWQASWVLLATAAAVLLVLGVVLQGTGGRPRSDDVAPRPDRPRIELPADIGRDWKVADLSTPARLDLDGDGTPERVEFLAEPTSDFDGRIRLQTTLSTTGGEAYGIAELGTTIGTTALQPIDADSDGDQELVLWYDDVTAVGGGGYPLVLDLREGLLVQAVAQDPGLLVRGDVPVPGAGTEHYEMVRIHDYWIDGGRLLSSRSVNAYAAGNMTLLRPETIVVDTWEWALGEDGVLTAS